MDENSAYRLAGETPLQLRDESVTSPSTQDRLGQVSTGKDSVGKGIEEASPSSTRTKRFIPPTVDEVRAYCQERQNGVDPQRFVDYYSSNGWMVGKNKMKDWKAAVRTWEQKERQYSRPAAPKSSNPFLDMLEDGDYE